MSKERSESFARQLSTMLQQLSGVRGERDKVLALSALHQKAEQFDKAMEMTAAVVELQQNEAVVLGALEELTGRGTAESAYELLTDIGARIDLTDKLFEDWRNNIAQFELAVASNVFDTPESRANAEGKLATSKERYEVSLELLEQFTPGRSAAIAPAGPVGTIGVIGEAGPALKIVT